MRKLTDEEIDIIEQGVFEARECMKGAAMVVHETRGSGRKSSKIRALARQRWFQYREIARKLNRGYREALRDVMGF